MRRGTRVGQAYVAVTVDGSGINKGITDAVDDATDHMGDAGEDGGEDYGDGFSEGFISRMRSKIPKINRRLSESIGESGEDAGGRFSKRLTDTLDRTGDKVGRSLGVHIAEALGEHMEGALAQLADRISNQMEDVLASNSQFLSQSLAENQVSGNSGRPSSGGGRDDRLGDRVGSLFGGDTHIGPLRVLGKSIGGIINLVGSLRAGAAGLFKTFSEGFSSAGEGAGLFSKLLAGGGASLASFGSSLAAMGPVALAVAAAMSVLVSVMSALLALVIALASTIASALVGALLVLGGAFSAVIAGAGLLTLAITSMTDAQRELFGASFTPLKEALVGLGQIMLNDIVPAFSVWATNLQAALVMIIPLVEVMGKAFAQAGTILTAAFSGAGFQNFTDALTTYLPDIVTNLSTALGGFLNGMLGLFAAVMPFVSQFAMYLAQVAERFSTWANSAAGQNAIVDFTTRAVESLRSLWGAVQAFVGFVNSVLFSPQAQQAGNSMFDSLTETFNRWRASVTAAAADGRLKKWFDDAIKFGKSLKDIIAGLSSAFAAMNSSGVLSAFGTALSAVGKVISALSPLLKPLVVLIGAGLLVVLGPAAGVLLLLAGALKLVAKGFSFLTDIVKRLVASGAFDGMVDWFVRLWSVSARVFDAVKRFASFVGGGLVKAISAAIPGLSSLANAIGRVGDLIDRVTGKAGAMQAAVGGAIKMGDKGGSGLGASSIAGAFGALQSSGASALAATSVSSGGYKSPKGYKNPYVAWANSLIKSGPSTVAMIRTAITNLNKEIAAAITAAANSASGSEVQDSMRQVYQSLLDGGRNTVAQAQEAINSAASRLASATSKGEAARALKAVKKAQADMRLALDAQRRLAAAARIVNAQSVIKTSNVDSMVAGLRTTNLTLAEFAAAQEILATRLDAAKTKLADAISLRDDFKASVIESIASFGSLVSAQAQSLDGVAQALTATDVTQNLEERLAKIKAFQDNLRLLVAQGLSNEAYKQLVNAGVEGGSSTAAALVAGGVGSIQQVNDLLAQIGAAGEGLGSAASSRLYQAGVDAAQGLVDGLTSLSAQLDAAAAKLGLSIATAIKKALGINSPSKVLYDLMYDNVGDGMVNGLNAAQNKVGSAATALASRVAVSPEVAAYAARQRGTEPVSGNQTTHEWNITTPTEDPKAVAQEMINEMTGRL